MKKLLTILVISRHRVAGLEHLPKGIYIVGYANGDKTHTKKIIL